MAATVESDFLVVGDVTAGSDNRMRRSPLEFGAVTGLLNRSVAIVQRHGCDVFVAGHPGCVSAGDVAEGHGGADVDAA